MRPFARHYDLIYADKDYASDIATLSAFVPATEARALSVLELGAGTGNHTHRLAAMFARVTSLEIDRDFCEVARSKLAGTANVDLQPTPVQGLAQTGFDAAVAFFHVLNYLPPAERQSFLSAVGERLRPGALFLADLWHAEAVELDPPRPETRHKSFGDRSVRQSITPVRSGDGTMVRLDYDFSIEAPPAPAETFRESLSLGLWRRPDLERALAAAGLGQIEFLDYKRPDTPAGPGSWRIWLKARKAG